MRSEASCDASPLALSCSQHRSPWEISGDSSPKQLQRNLANLDVFREALAASTHIVVLESDCFSGSPLVYPGSTLAAYRRSTWDTNALLHDLAQSDCAAPSSFAEWLTAPRISAGGAAATLTVPTALNNTGVARCGDVAALSGLSCEALPGFGYFTAPEDICPPTSTLPPVAPASTPVSPFSCQFVNRTDDLDSLEVSSLMLQTLLWLMRPSRMRVTIDLDRLPEQRENMLLLLDGIRAVLCITLVLVLAALARRPNVRNLVLVLVAASRCYGHRGEPDDHLLPAHRSKSIVRGELVLVA